jgi:hypothetical protein
MADSVAKVFWAATRATLIRWEPSNEKEDSKRYRRQSENCPADLSSRLCNTIGTNVK